MSSVRLFAKVTSRMLGAFRDDPATRQEFLTALT
jgi:hypothetical protein